MIFSKYFKSNKGTSIVIFTIALSAIVGCGAIVIDVGNVAVQHQKLQTAIDAAVLAAAPDLPDTSVASQTVRDYIVANGFKESDVNITFSDSNTKVTITATKKVEYTFAKMLGFDSTTTTCTSAAVTESMGGAFDYVLFSGSKTATLSLTGTNVTVNGNSHTNASFIANGANHTITGACEALKNIVVGGSSMNINNRVQNAPFVEMPDFSEMIKAQAQKSGTFYNFDMTFYGSDLNLDSPLYVNGSITINGSHFRGKGCILATGDITFNGSNLYDSTTDSVCFYSKSGNIIINGSNASLDGIVYAPGGSVKMNGSSQNINGRIIANSVIFTGGNCNIKGGADDLKSIPTKGSRLVK